MHGIIHAELKKYVETTYGGTTWRDLLAAAGLSGTLYLPMQEYPDAEVVALVTAAAAATGTPAAAILEDFGRFIVPDLVKMYRSVIPPHWTTLDLIEHTEETIHRVVRLRQPGAAPPALQVRRLSPQALEIVYTSPRKLCAVAKGIAHGVAAHYQETIGVAEPQCMHRGATSCRIQVRQRAA